MHVDVVINLAHVRPSTGLSELGMNRFGTDVRTKAWNRDKPQQLKMVMRTVIASFLAKNECSNTQRNIHTMHGPARRTAHPLTIKHRRILRERAVATKNKNAISYWTDIKDGEGRLQSEDVEDEVDRYKRRRRKIHTLCHTSA